MPTTNNQFLQTQLSQLKQREEEDAARKTADKLNLTYVNLLIAPTDPEDFKIVSEEKAKRGKLFVIRKTGSVLQIAIKDPEDPETEKIIKELQDDGFECHFFIASLSGLKTAWQKYQTIETKPVFIRDILEIQMKELEEFKTSIKTVQELKKTINKVSTTNLLTIIIAGAIEMKASDIHLEPEENFIRLRYRIDGLLQTIAEFPTKTYKLLLSRIKTLAGMFINIHDISQDGRFAIALMRGDEAVRRIDLRISILPSTQAESVVIRLLGTEISKLKIEELGLRPESLQMALEQIAQPNGIALTTGPTGSGKTTTLYAFLNYLNQPGEKIITVEDPIEYKLSGITQTQVNESAGQTFAQSLKSIVRQDPDILMVGEIRDKESADIAIRFSLTGHLVLSTLHTNDAVSTIARLADIGVNKSFIASTLRLVIAQRLIRKLCPYCRTEYKPEKELLKKANRIIGSISPKSNIKIPKEISVFYKPKGCKKCHGIGYNGRIGIFEFLKVTQEIQKLILNESAPFELEEKAVEEGMLTLMQDAVLKVAEGITSVEEVRRIIGLF